MLCLQKKTGTECFSFSGKFDYVIHNLTSLKQFSLIRTAISVLILYLFLLTLDIEGQKGPHVLLVGLMNTEN